MTVEGKPLHVTKWGGKVRVGPSLESKDLKNVISADNKAINGVVHIIDGVLLPPSTTAMQDAVVMADTKTIVDLAVGTKDLSTLVTALKAADLVTTLSGKGPFTVFAPTNEAFAKLDKRVLDYLLEPQHKEQLTKVLTYHVVAGEAKSTDLKNGELIKTVEGQQVRVELSGKSVKINNADVTTADVLATNGVVHIIDHVLIPHWFALPTQAATENPLIV